VICGDVSSARARLTAAGQSRRLPAVHAARCPGHRKRSPSLPRYWPGTHAARSQHRPVHDCPALSPGDGPVLRAALYLVLVALLSLGAATVVREAAASTGVVLGLLWLFPVIAAVVGKTNLGQ
jgi:hypothetical protein